MPKNDTDDGDADREDVQMNFLASQSQRERWEEHAKEEGFRNLSGFFRFAIENQVKGRGDNGTGGTVSEDLSGQLTEIVEGINRVESQMHDLDNRLATIETEVRDDPETKKLANEVFAVLPTRSDMVEYVKTTQKAGTAPGSPATAGTVEGITEELGEEEYRVEQALRRLQQDTHQVSRSMITEEVDGWTTMYGEDDEPRYYKEG